MFKFKKVLKCSVCGSEDNGPFVHPTKGQGIRCRDCLHESIVVTPNKPSHKTRFKDRMRVGWGKFDKSPKRSF